MWKYDVRWCEEAYIIGAEDGEDLLQRNELVGGGEAVSVGAPERPGLLVAHEHIDRVALGHREPCAAPHSTLNILVQCCNMFSYMYSYR